MSGVHGAIWSQCAPLAHAPPLSVTRDQHGVVELHRGNGSRRTSPPARAIRDLDRPRLIAKDAGALQRLRDQRDAFRLTPIICASVS
jgi:hypothetical protein